MTAQLTMDIGEQTDTLRVLVVDDHRVFSDLLALAMSMRPGLACVGTAASAAEGVAMAAELRPDVVVMDIEMPRQSGLSATRRIRELTPRTAVVIVSAHREPEWIAKAAQAGASAFVPKDGSFAELIDVLGRVQQGTMLVAPSTFRAEPVVTDRAHRSEAPALTPREHDVLVGLGRGLSMNVIAHQHGIAVQTCRGYTKSLLGKLDVHSQLEAVVKAQSLGLLQLTDG